ncbi:preprotein translocase subunit YajC [uncultured Limosilactobacillus sp.]|uniref:preprotein translocase subunit YajC n=1 Tax=uncultured Limosilactobacillus sp. TaxID=2837629 RepID=UPI0025E4AF21|nr:preprotein translocase subunit YajC [uncultured Limosilactobacillus sp.]
MNNNTLSSLGLIVLMVIFMYFFLIRPQQKQRKAHQSMMSKLKKGDHVVTIGRLHGVVYDLNEAKRTVTLDCDGIYLTFDLGAIMRVTAQSAAEEQHVAEKPAASTKSDDKQSSEEKAASANDQDKEEQNDEAQN